MNFGVVMDESLEDEVKVTVIATGFQRDSLPEFQRRKASDYVGERGSSRGEQPAAAPPEVKPMESVFELSSQPAHVEAASETEYEEEPQMMPLLREEPRPVQRPTTEEQGEGEQVVEQDTPLDLNDIEKPAYLRRERKLFQ